MKLKSIIIPGIVGAGIGTFAAGAEGLQPWQIDLSKPNQITVHVKRGDTLNEIANYLDRNFGKYDDSADAARNLAWHLKSGDIFYTDCRNRITNPNIIEAGRDIGFKEKILEEIDPNYGKSNIPEHKDYERGIAEKKIEIKTESKTRIPKHKERSLMSDISRVRDYTNKDDNRTGKFVLSGEIGYSIFGENIGESVVMDLNAGYQVPGITFTIGGRLAEIPREEYYNYKRSFFGLLYEAELDEEYLTTTDLYAQLMFGSNTFKIGGGYNVKNIGLIKSGESYGYWEGEGGATRDYDRYRGYFGSLQIMLPISKNASAGIVARYGEYKAMEGLKLNETSVSARLEAKF